MTKKNSKKVIKITREERDKMTYEKSNLTFSSANRFFSGRWASCVQRKDVIVIDDLIPFTKQIARSQSSMESMLEMFTMTCSAFGIPAQTDSAKPKEITIASIQKIFNREIDLARIDEDAQFGKTDYMTLYTKNFFAMSKQEPLNEYYWLQMELIMPIIKRYADGIFYVKSAKKSREILAFTINGAVVVINEKFAPFITNHLSDGHFTAGGGEWDILPSQREKHELTVSLMRRICGIPSTGSNDFKNSEKYHQKHLTLGLDPEFTLYERDSDGDAYYPGMVRTDRLFGGRQAYGDIGTDGNPRIGEMRPEPSNSPEELANSIHELFVKLEGKIREAGCDFFVETGGGHDQAIGGHIHIGHPLFKGVNSSRDPGPKLIGMLDDFLYIPMRNRMLGGVRRWQGAIQEGSLMLEPEYIKDFVRGNKELITAGRYSSNYESASSWRSKPWGFEYRSLPSFISNREFTILVLKIAKALCEKYITDVVLNLQEFSYNEVVDFDDYAELIGNKDAKMFMKYLDSDIFLRDARKEWGTIGMKFLPISVNLVGYEPMEFSRLFGSEKQSIWNITKNIESRLNKDRELAEELNKQKITTIKSQIYFTGGRDVYFQLFKNMDDNIFKQDEQVINFVNMYGVVNKSMYRMSKSDREVTMAMTGAGGYAQMANKISPSIIIDPFLCETSALSGLVAPDEFIYDSILFSLSWSCDCIARKYGKNSIRDKYDSVIDAVRKKLWNSISEADKLILRDSIDRNKKMLAGIKTPPPPRGSQPRMPDGFMNMRIGWDEPVAAPQVGYASYVVFDPGVDTEHDDDCQVDGTREED